MNFHRVEDKMGQQTVILDAPPPLFFIFFSHHVIDFYLRARHLRGSEASSP